MTQSYATVKASFESEFVIERSRFIGRICPVSGEERAREEIAAVRKAHPFATHVCWAYVADGEGAVSRYSDDGEPQGTAGLPILEVLKNRAIRCALITVTRYFGGVKLGAGGLVRAYTRAAADAAAGAERAYMTYALRMRLALGYELLSVYDKAALPGEETGRTFGEKVEILRAVPESECGAFGKAVAELFLGKVTAERAGEGYYSFSKK